MICHIHLWSFFVFINVRSIVFPLVILLWCPSLRSDLGDFNFEKLKSLGQRFLFYCIFLFYLVFFFFTNHGTEWEGGGHFYNSSLPLPPASQTLRHQPGDYCRELTSVHRQQLVSNWEPLVSEDKSGGMFIWQELQ